MGYLGNAPTSASSSESGPTGGNFKGGPGEKGSFNSADIFRVHANTLYSSTTIDSDENASCVGPLTVANNIVLTISPGSRLVVI